MLMDHNEILVDHENRLKVQGLFIQDLIDRLDKLEAKKSVVVPVPGPVLVPAIQTMEFKPQSL